VSLGARHPGQFAKAVVLIRCAVLWTRRRRRIGPGAWTLPDFFPSILFVVDVLGDLAVGVDQDNRIAHLVVASLAHELRSTMSWRRSTREADAVFLVVLVLPAMIAGRGARDVAVRIDHRRAPPDGIILERRLVTQRVGHALQHSAL